MMISKKMEKALNEQLELEAAACFNYLAMASWCEKEGLEGAANFFYKHSVEENSHMMKVFSYINEVKGHALTPAVKQPKLEFKSVLDVCQIALKQEQKVSKAVHDLVELAVSEKDHVTNDFLRFFVDEQKEEEVLFQRVIDRIKLIGSGGQSLYYIDRELGTIAAQPVE